MYLHRFGRLLSIRYTIFVKGIKQLNSQLLFFLILAIL